MLRRLPALAWLVVLWVALWGELTLANVIAGAVIAVGVQLVFSRAAPGPAGSVRPLALLRYGVYFAWKIIEANALVAWEVMTPGSRIRMGIVAVPIHGASDVVVTALANSISLTPGTLTLEVDRSKDLLYVHVLHVHSVEQTRKEILRLEYALLRAVDPACAAQAAATLQALEEETA